MTTVELIILIVLVVGVVVMLLGHLGYGIKKDVDHRRFLSGRARRRQRVRG